MDPDDYDHLQNIVSGGLMRKVTPSHIEEKFLGMGYIRRSVGGLMPTEAGHKAFMTLQKEAKK